MACVRACFSVDLQPSRALIPTNQVFALGFGGEVRHRNDHQAIFDLAPAILGVDALAIELEPGLHVVLQVGDRGLGPVERELVVVRATAFGVGVTDDQELTGRVAQVEFAQLLHAGQRRGQQKTLVRIEEELQLREHGAGHGAELTLLRQPCLRAEHDQLSGHCVDGSVGLALEVLERERQLVVTRKHLLVQEPTLLVRLARKRRWPRDRVVSLRVAHSAHFIEQLDEQLSERRLEHHRVRHLRLERKGPQLSAAEHDLGHVGLLGRLAGARLLPA